MELNIGISEKDREAVCDRLQQILADEYVLYTKTRNYHWNIISKNFSELHAFYEGQYEELATIIDEVAERIRMLGFMSTGKMSDFLKRTQLQESEYTSDAGIQLNHLMEDHATLIRTLRKYIPEFADTYGDAGSSDFITALMEKHEKMHWMLRSFKD